MGERTHCLRERWHDLGRPLKARSAYLHHLLQINEEIEIGLLVYNVANDEASVNGVRLELPRRELSVLAALVRRRGRTLLRATLEQAVFGFDDEVQLNTLNSHISRLRKKLSGTGAEVEINVIRGVGYLLRASK